MPQAYFTFAKQIFHIEDISLVPKERISLKKPRQRRGFFWLGWQDSNLRMQQSKCCVLPLDDTPMYSIFKKKTPPLCLTGLRRRFKMGWNIGFEPMVSSATNWRFNQLS